MILNADILDIEKPEGICSLILVVDEFWGLFLHPSIFSIIYSRSAGIINGDLSNFWNWLNYNILVLSEGIIILQKSLISYAF